MKAKWFFVVLLITFISLSAPATGVCDQGSDTFQSRLKNLEKQEFELQSAINFWEEIQGQLRSGQYIVWPFRDDTKRTYVMPITREQFNKLLNVDLLTGKLDSSKAAKFVEKCNFVTREMLAQVPGEISMLEREKKKVKDQLSALLNERARNRESQTGTCTWQDCPCQWLANTCTGGAKYGTSKETCKEWGGTYWHDSGHCGKGNCSFSEVCPWPGHYCCK
jgi:hypothetical protein